MPDLPDLPDLLDLLDIGEVADRSGLATSALRFYEHEELIASVDRKGLRRQYRADVMTTLAVVTICRRAGSGTSCGRRRPPTLWLTSSTTRSPVRVTTWSTLSTSGPRSMRLSPAP
jgi:MerR family regulatory protein